jgi:hypothetical protein
MIDHGGCSVTVFMDTSRKQKKFNRKEKPRTDITLNRPCGVRNHQAAAKPVVNFDEALKIHNGELEAWGKERFSRYPAPSAIARNFGGWAINSKNYFRRVAPIFGSYFFNDP